MRGRSVLIAIFCGVLVLGVAALVVAGVSDRRSTAFSVDVPPSSPVAIVGPRQTVCQAPISVAEPTAGMTVWAAGGSPGTARFLVTVRALNSNVLLARAELTSPSPSAALIPLAGALTHSLGASQRVSICLSSTSRGVVDLLGSASNPTSGALTLGGKASNLALAMLFSTPRPRSLVALLPTVFARAALFHPGWMGAWTFWALLVGLVVAAALALRSMLTAAAEDELADQRRDLERVSPQTDDRQ
jgi:hypothetical protein